MKKEIVTELVQELDSVGGSINVRKETLNDVSSKFFSAVTEMNDAIHRGDQQFYFREYQEELRVLSNLMHYCMVDLTQDVDELSILKKSLFDEIVKTSCEKRGPEEYSFSHTINLEGPQTPVTGYSTVIDEATKDVVQCTQVEADNREAFIEKAKKLKAEFLETQSNRQNHERYCPVYTTKRKQ